VHAFARVKNRDNYSPKVMHWNYRVFKQDKDGRTVYSVREAYYDENNKPSGWTERAETLDDYEDPDELLKALRMMVKDVEKSIADALDFDAEPEGDNLEIEE
jgi:hypothetical protein